MRQHVPPQQLWKEFQGDLDFDYDHEVYWPALLKLCEERKTEQRERWVKAGRHYGESEIYIRGGSASSIGSVPNKEGKTLEKENIPLKEEDTKEKGEEAQVPVKAE